MNVHTSFFLTILVNILYVFYTAEMKKWYVVYEGSVPGVYEHWEDCFKQVNKFKGNNYKSYKIKAEVEARYLNYVTPWISELSFSKNFSDLFLGLRLGLILITSLDLKLEHISFPCSSSP